MENSANDIFFSASYKTNFGEGSFHYQHDCDWLRYRGVHEKGLLSLSVHSVYLHYLSIYPSAYNQLSERFSGNQLYRKGSFSPSPLKINKMDYDIPVKIQHENKYLSKSSFFLIFSVGSGHICLILSNLIVSGTSANKHKMTLTKKIFLFFINI